MGTLLLNRTAFLHPRMNEKQLREHIEALLFGLGRPLSHAELAEMLDTTIEKIRAAVGQKEEGRGVEIVDDGRVLELRAGRDAAELIEKMRREEYTRDVGRAGLEVLAAILYRGPLSRSEIDFIRGVNSSQTIRTLTTRGLIRKVSNPKDERSFLYEPTTELLSQLGITAVSELEDYAAVRGKLEVLERSYREKELDQHS